MHSFGDMVWVELRKALRSRMPLWTALGSLFMPLGIAFLIFVAKNPQIAAKLGLISVKANLLAYSAADWQTYLTVYAEIIGAGGLILFVLILSWIFGREFADGTLKDMLAVPVPRGSILLAKYAVAAIWAAGLSLVIYAAGLLMGVLLKLPGASLAIFLTGSLRLVVTACLAMVAVLPFALFAFIGRGYLLPIGAMMLSMMMINFAQILGWGQYFPCAVPVMFAEGKVALAPISYALVFMTSALGVTVTYLWWKYADQNK
jgi:ABC-2 type transport system permease protein